MLIVMAVIVAISSAMSRSNRPTPAVTTSDEGRITTPVTEREDLTTQPSRPAVTQPTSADTEASVPSGNIPSQDTVPTLASPVAQGILSHGHTGKDLVYSSTMEDYRAHVGIDVNAKLGDEVYATADGRILDVWYDAMMGRCIKVEHNGGLEIIYKNIDEDLPDGIGIGSSVMTGDVIGYIGESAMIELAQEPHLHLEARIDGRAVDPMTLMSEEAMRTLTEDTGYGE